MTDKKAIISVDSVTFNMPTVTKDIINQNAVAKVNEFLHNVIFLYLIHI